MRVVFLGTPALAVPSLDALVPGHDVAAVVTQPDRPRGRGRRLAPPPVKVRALELGIDCRQPESLDGAETLEALDAARPDVIAVVAYGQKIPDAVLALPPHGAVNLHFSLLPAYRGAAPINWAIIRGETETGVSTFRITSRMDAGPLYLQERLAMLPEETAGELGGRLAAVGAPLLKRTLDFIESGEARPRPQDEAGASRAPKLKKADGEIDWGRPAAAIVNLVRGTSPWPGAWSVIGGEAVKVWRATARGRPAAAPPGTVLAATPRAGLVVAAGEGAVDLQEVQAPGGRRLPARDYLAGHHRLRPGSRIG